MRLNLIEDASVIYRIVRAPEKRVFFVDVGTMPPSESEEYIQTLMEEYKAPKIYDPETGEVVTKQSYMNMMEDIWIPTNSDGKGTRIETLEGGKNLGEIEDIEYFQKKLFKALRIPRKRINPENSYTYISNQEINYEEYQFVKYVSEIRKRFSMLFYDLLKKQCVYKEIMSVNDFDKLNLNFIWDSDSKFDQTNKLDLLEKQLGTLSNIEGYVGKFFSETWIKKNVLGMTENEIENMFIEMVEEKKLKEKYGIDKVGDDESSGSGRLF